MTCEENLEQIKNNTEATKNEVINAKKELKDIKMLLDKIAVGFLGLDRPSYYGIQIQG